MQEMAEILNIVMISNWMTFQTSDVLLVEEEEDIEEVWTVVQQSLRTLLKILEMRGRKGKIIRVLSIVKMHL